MSIKLDKLLRSEVALQKLAILDEDIAVALAKYGSPQDRFLPANFATLAKAIIGQQISRSAASAIWQRVYEQNMHKEENVADISVKKLMQLGLSLRKAEYLIGIAKELKSGQLDLKSLHHLSGNDAQARLIKIRGVGTWTADNFRLFALGDMDAWPVNDLALQESMRRLKKLVKRPNAKQMEQIGTKWQPYRGAGALILWHIYSIEVRRTTISAI